MLKLVRLRYAFWEAKLQNECQGQTFDKTCNRRRLKWNFDGGFIDRVVHVDSIILLRIWGKMCEMFWVFIAPLSNLSFSPLIAISLTSLTSILLSFLGCACV